MNARTIIYIKDEGKEEHREGRSIGTSLRMMEATCLVMSVPAIPIAIPQSAFLIAEMKRIRKRFQYDSDVIFLKI